MRPFFGAFWRPFFAAFKRVMSMPCKLVTLLQGYISCHLIYGGNKNISVCFFLNNDMKTMFIKK